MSFNSDLSNTTRIPSFNLDFEVDSTCTTVPPAVQLSTGTSSVQIDSITVLPSSKNCSDSTVTAAATVEKTSLLLHLPIAKKKSKSRRNKTAQNSGYHPRCLPRLITENKKLSYHLRIEKSFLTNPCNCFGLNYFVKSVIYSPIAKTNFNCTLIQKVINHLCENLLRNIMHLVGFSADFKQLSCGKHIYPRKNIKNALA